MKQKINNLVHKMGFHLSFLFALGFIVSLVATIGMTYYRLNSTMYNNYINMANGVTKLMSTYINPESLDYYISDNYSSYEYNDTLKKLHLLKDNYPDILYMYVYRFSPEIDHAGEVIFDLDEEYTENPPKESIEWIGSMYELDEPFRSEWEKLYQDPDPIYHKVVTPDKEQLFSYVKPIYHNGKYTYSACVDFSITQIRKKNIKFAVKLLLTLTGLDVFMWFVFMYFINERICGPINRLKETIDDFKYGTIEDRFGNLSKLENLYIRRGNEISLLYDSFLFTMKESTFYFQNYKNAENTITEMKTTVYKDELTKVGNKNKYKSETERLEKEISNGTAKFGIVIADINNLKYVNDAYGHQVGDEYIKNCCKILCEIFKHSIIARIGGDEFVCIVENNDYNLIKTLVDNTKMIFNSYNENTYLEPYERYSMSIGYAIYDNTHSLKEIIKIADNEMYEDKKAYKEKYGSYR